MMMHLLIVVGAPFVLVSLWGLAEFVGRRVVQAREKRRAAERKELEEMLALVPEARRVQLANMFRWHVMQGVARGEALVRTLHGISSISVHESETAENKLERMTLAGKRMAEFHWVLYCFKGGVLDAYGLPTVEEGLAP